MVDLMGQYSKIKHDIDKNIISTIESGRFVNGPIVTDFAKNLSAFLEIDHVIPCANGTDALQVAFMSLDLKPGDDVVEKAEDYFEKNNTDKIIFFDSEQLMICVQGSPDAKAKRKKGKGLEYEYVEGIMVGKSKS